MAKEPIKNTTAQTTVRLRLPKRSARRPLAAAPKMQPTSTDDTNTSCPRLLRWNCWDKNRSAPEITPVS